MDAHVSWRRFREFAAADGPARRRQNFWDELVHAYGAALARPRHVHGARDAEPRSRDHYQSAISRTLPNRRDRLRKSDRRWAASTRFFHGAGAALRFETWRKYLAFFLWRAGGRSGDGANGVRASHVRERRRSGAA